MAQKLTGYKKFMSDDEIKKLLEFINSKPIQIRLIFYILIFMGLRVGEVCRLERHNVQGSKLVFALEKSNRIHERVIPNWIKDMIYKYIKDFKINDGWLWPTSKTQFYNGRNEHIVTDTMGWYINHFRNESGLTDIYYVCKDGKRLYRISVHTLRHWFLSKLWDKTKDIVLVANIISHKKINTTFAYIMAYEKQQRETDLVNEIAMMPELAIQSL